MVFNSFNFWLIFPFIFAIYWLIPRTYNSLRKLFLVIVSYLLYMNWDPAFSLVLAGVTLITYWGGVFYRIYQNYEQKEITLWLLCCVGGITSYYLQILQLYKRFYYFWIGVSRFALFTSRIKLGHSCWYKFLYISSHRVLNGCV